MPPPQYILDAAVGDFLWSLVEHTEVTDPCFVLDGSGIDLERADALACHLLSCSKAFETAYLGEHSRQAKRSYALKYLADTRPRGPGVQWRFEAGERPANIVAARVFLPNLIDFLAYLPRFDLSPRELRAHFRDVVFALPLCLADYSFSSRPILPVKYLHARDLRNLCPLPSTPQFAPRAARVDEPVTPLLPPPFPGAFAYANVSHRAPPRPASATPRPGPSVRLPAPAAVLSNTLWVARRIRTPIPTSPASGRLP